MNNTNFIIKILNKPEYILYEQTISLTEAIGKFYQFRNNSHTICKLSFWGQSAYDILKYNKTHDYLLVEGHLLLRQATFKKSNIITNIELSIFNVYPFQLNIKQVKK